MRLQFLSPKNTLSISLLIIYCLSLTPALAIALPIEIALVRASRNLSLTKANYPFAVGPSIGNKVNGPGHYRVVARLSLITQASSQDDKIPYGNNPQAGRYVDVGDAKLYYEVYGKGKPILLLHGGVYGYIDELGPFIEKLAQTNLVICLATRGHGRSEIGSSPFSYRQRAQDAYQLIRSITSDSVLVLGFSDGAFTGYKLAALYPQVVKKLVAIGAGDRPKASGRPKRSYSPQVLLSQSKTFFEGRLALMPQPNRWGECLSWLNQLYNDDYLSTETFAKITCPVLVMGGDRDEYESVQQLAKASQSITTSQLSIIPGCGHVVFFCNFPALWEAIQPFLQ